jgi:hypothetical protein
VWHTRSVVESVRCRGRASGTCERHPVLVASGA